MIKTKLGLTQTKINLGRQIELDVAKALAVLFMVLVHVQMTFSNSKLEESNLGTVVDFLGGIPAAPIFMMLMGIGFAYSKSSHYKSFIKKGISILILGYLLNTLREVIPELIDYFYYQEEEALENAIEGFINIDILQFAGLTTILWGFVIKMKLNNYKILSITLLFSFLNMALLNFKFENYFLQATTGLLWGSSDISEFPFFTWIVYPIAGYYLAQFLLTCQNKSKFYKILLISSTLLCSVFAYFILAIFKMDVGLDSEITYYHHNLITNLLFTFFCIFWLSILYFLYKILPNFIIKPIKRWSKNVTEIYFIHWILIGWIAWYFDEETNSTAIYLSICVIIFILSDFIAHLLNKNKIKLK